MGVYASKNLSWADVVDEANPPAGAVPTSAAEFRRLDNGIEAAHTELNNLGGTYYTKTQADGLFLPSNSKGVAGGVGTLDANGKQPLSEVNAAVLGGARRQGTWDASLGTAPATGLADNGTDRGKYWEVSVAGTTLLGGKNDWQPGDWIIWEGLDWGWVDNTDRVGSVNGRTGAVAGLAEATQLPGAATETVMGVVELATPAELQTGAAGSLVPSAAGFKAEQDKQTTTRDILTGGFVAEGLLPAVPSPASLSMGIPAGVAYASAGADLVRLAEAAEPARAYAASSDTYVDLSGAGVYSYAAVANGAAAPALAAGSIRLFRVVTSATAITSVADLRTLNPPVKGAAAPPAPLAWTAIPLAAGVAPSTSAAHQTPQYAKDAHGFVHLRGLVSVPALVANGIVGTLPAGFRPGAQEVFVVFWNGTAGQMRFDVVASDGTLRNLVATAAGQVLSLAGITFAAA